MKTKQQKETLNYFRKYADKWKDKPIIKQRNDFVLKVISERKTDLFLDIGCGTGKLVNKVASKGIQAIGVDFSEEMIKIADKECKQAEFICCSIFDFPFRDKYDVISANGLIEYISYKELDKLLNLSRKALKPGGSLILSSRNRLFNIFSLNEYTK